MPDLSDLNPVLREREERRQDRLKNIRQSSAVPRVRVLPRDDLIRKHIYHPRGRIRFPAQGSVEWPFDQFTKRRIRDGDVTIDESRAQSGAPARNPAEQSRAE